MLTAERKSAEEARQRVRLQVACPKNDIQHRRPKKKRRLCVEEPVSPDEGKDSDDETVELKAKVYSPIPVIEHEFTGKVWSSHDCLELSITGCYI